MSKSTKAKKPPKVLMSSQSTAGRSCGFCKISGHNFTTCDTIASHQASAYRKNADEVQRMMNYLGKAAKCLVEVLPNDLLQQFRGNPQWNCMIWPKEARHIMLCNLYYDFRKTNGSEADNIVAVQFFAEGGSLSGIKEVCYSEVKVVRQWCAGLILSELHEIK
jgi:hypothetical protein